MQDYTIDSENNKVLFYTEEENKNYQNLANEIRIQNKILEEYKLWVKTLLSVINKNNNLIDGDNVYDDIGTPIQQNLENIEKLKEENMKIKKKIINQKLKNEKTEKNLEKKHQMQNMIIKEFNEKNNNSSNDKFKQERMQLNDNVQMLANELDELNENNKQLHDKIMKDEKLKNIYEMINLRNKLKEENKLYKKIMVLKNRKDFIDLKETLQSKDSTIDFTDKRINNIKNSSNTINREFGSIGPISGYGEYKLEKEENIHSNGSIFFCGL
jgi:DNA polymerase III gamma/tau subunit